MFVNRNNEEHIAMDSEQKMENGKIVMEFEAAGLSIKCMFLRFYSV